MKLKDEVIIGGWRFVPRENGLGVIPCETKKESVKVIVPDRDLMEDIHRYLVTNKEEYKRIHEMGFAGDSITYELYYDDAKELHDRVRKAERNWIVIRKWLEAQREDRRYANDVERYTAYDATLKEMDRLEGLSK